ncbi:FUSC family protein [Neomicrococcus lactis]
MSHNYWAMVAAVVPLVGKTMRHRIARGAHRILGTFVGLGLMAIVVALNPSPVVAILIIGLMQFMAEMFIARNYFFAQIFVTPLAVVGTGLASGTTSGLVYDRFMETLIGAVVGIGMMLIGNQIRKRLSTD